MASFEYSSIAVYVTVTYKCPHCGEENTTQAFPVPALDLMAESHHDSINSDMFETNCENCGELFDVTLATGIYGGEVYMDEVEEILNVEEEIPGEDDNYFDQELYKATHSEIERVMEKMDVLDDEAQAFLYRLLYASVISRMEAYLSDTLIAEVLRTKESQRKFTEKYLDFKNKGLNLTDIYVWIDRLPTLIRETLKDLIYHNLPKIKPIYNAVLDVDLGDIGYLMKAIQVRHHIVHRNGIDKDGNICDINKEQVTELAARVAKFIGNIDKQLQERRLSELAANSSSPWY